MRVVVWLALPVAGARQRRDEPYLWESPSWPRGGDGQLGDEHYRLAKLGTYSRKGQRNLRFRLISVKAKRLIDRRRLAVLP